MKAPLEGSDHTIRHEFLQRSHHSGAGLSTENLSEFTNIQASHGHDTGNSAQLLYSSPAKQETVLKVKNVLDSVCTVTAIGNGRTRSVLGVWNCITLRWVAD